MNAELEAALIPVDQAFRDSEARWGVGRLACLVSPETLLSFKRGFAMWTEAISAGNVEAVKGLAPKMLRALEIMDREADARGHVPLEPEVWETRLEDGRVLAVVRTTAEAHAVGRQATGRDVVCWSLEEIARVLPRMELLHEVKAAFPGARVAKLTTRDASFPDDLAKSDPLLPLLHGKAA